MFNKVFLFNTNMLKCKPHSNTRCLSGISDNKESNIEMLKNLFKQYDRPKNYDALLEKHPKLKKLTKASVLVPISIKEIKKENSLEYETFYTLTQRTPNLKFYGGQICFIGGKMDPVDNGNAVETALREAKEEVNVSLERLTILAQMHPLIITNVGNDSFLLYPIIAFYDNANFSPDLNRDEVECLYELPTKRFLSSENHELSHVELTNIEYHLHYFNDIINNNEITIWSITALISIIVSSILHNRAPAFEIDPIVQLNPNNVNQFFDDFVLKSTKLLDHFHRPKY